MTADAAATSSATTDGSSSSSSSTSANTAADTNALAEPAEFSWKVVAWIYFAGSLFCAGFAIGQHAFAMKQVEGFWLIFAFFPFCLCYSLLRIRAQSSVKAKGD